MVSTNLKLLFLSVPVIIEFVFFPIHKKYRKQKFTMVSLRLLRIVFNLFKFYKGSLED